MLRKFKGLDVPSPDPSWKNDYNDEFKARKKFCLKAKQEDCNQTSCEKCIFNPKPELYEYYNDLIFGEWYKAKGKVQYDKEEEK